MDKTTITHDRINSNTYQIHRLCGNIDPFFQEFGCSIIHTDKALRGNHEESRTPCRHFEFYCLSHLIEGHGFLHRQDGEEVEFEAGNIVICTPGTVHVYGGNHDCYVEDTICFSGRIPDLLTRNGIIANGVFSFGMTRRLLPIIELCETPLREKHLSANIMLIELLNSIYNENKELAQNRYPALAQLLVELKRTPERWWTVSEMAEFCKMSESHFRRLFQENIGVAPKNYLDRLKITQSCELLTRTNQTLAEIAKRLGYVDPFHFSRRFKELIGTPPSQYRLNFSRNRAIAITTLPEEP